MTNDTNVTGSITSQNLTLGWTGQLSLARGGTNASSFATSNNAVYYDGHRLTAGTSQAVTTPYASSTALTVSGTASTSILRLDSLTLGGLAIDASGKVYSAATSTLNDLRLACPHPARCTSRQHRHRKRHGSIGSPYRHRNLDVLRTTDRGFGLAFTGGQWAGAATTTFSSPLLYAAGNVTCQTASGSLAGCLSSADWTTFNNKQATISTTWPITLSGATIGFNGLSTTSAAVVGNIPYFSGVNTFANVATSSLSVGTGLTNSGTLGYQIGGSNASISFAAIAANSLWANATGGSAVPTAIATTSLFAGTNGQVLAFSGGTWTGIATTTFSTGLTYGSGAVTCDTASASIFGCLTAASFSKFNSATTTFSNGITYSAGVASLSAIAANSILANVSGASGVPTALATSSLFSLTGATTITYASSTAATATNFFSTYASTTNITAKRQRGSHSGGSVGIGTTTLAGKFAIDAGSYRGFLIGANGCNCGYNALSLNGDLADANFMGMTGEDRGMNNYTYKEVVSNLGQARWERRIQPGSPSTPPATSASGPRRRGQSCRSMAPTTPIG